MLTALRSSNIFMINVFILILDRVPSQGICANNINSELLWKGLPPDIGYRKHHLTGILTVYHGTDPTFIG